MCFSLYCCLGNLGCCYSTSPSTTGERGHNTAVDDVSIKVVDLEGRPVAGATIKFSGKDVGSTDRQGVDNSRAGASRQRLHNRCSKGWYGDRGLPRQVHSIENICHNTGRHIRHNDARQGGGWTAHTGSRRRAHQRCTTIAKSNNGRQWNCSLRRSHWSGL
jgi:hypothetical protein